jgi:predicted transcriptional regulator
MNVILSIKPKYVHAILAGEKLVEFRKAAFKKEVEKIYIYSSAPEKKIVGYFIISKVVEAAPKKLWQKFHRVGGIEKESFFDYYKDKELGYSLCISEVNQFDEHIDPYQTIKNFTPPQSYCYCKEL